jgi:SPP1 family predicted phage head-tail adaptor
MKSQQLTERIGIEKPSRISDGIGGTLTVWEVVGTYWAEPLYGSSNASMDFSRVEVRTGVDFVVRKEVAVKIAPNYRVVFKGKTYTITGIRTMAGDVYHVLSTQTDD